MNMHIENELNQGKAKKALKKKLLLIFFGVMILLTFFSNTINNFTLPRVKVEYPTSGALSKEIFASGVIIPKGSQSEYTTLNTTVEAVHVKTGETVKQGQLIMSLDKTDAFNRYQEEVLNLKKLRLGMETVSQAGSDAGNHSLARKRDEAKQKYEADTRNYERIKQLYDAGAESAQNYEKAESQMKTSAREYEQAHEDYEQGIKMAACNIEVQELKVASLKRELDTKYDIHAQCDGLVKEINFTSGSLVNSSKPLFVIADQSQGYEFKFSTSAELAAYLTRGDEFTISLKSRRQSLNGIVSRLVAGSEGQTDVFLDVKADGLAGGESGQALISKEIGSFDCLVSNAAVGKDSVDSFVWVIEERKGAFKNELYVKKLSVSVINSDSSKTALQKKSLNEDEEIVSQVERDRGLTDGCRVLMSE